MLSLASLGDHHTQRPITAQNHRMPGLADEPGLDPKVEGLSKDKPR
jgi:hypothetical protein